MRRTRQAEPQWRPEVPLPSNPRWFSPPDYGMPTFGDLFTPRQLVALTTFSDLVAEAMERVKRDYLGSRASRPRREQDALDPSVSGSRPYRGQDTLDMEGETPAYPDDETLLRDGGAGATAYAEAVGVYLCMGVNRLADRSSTICSWDVGYAKIRNTFSRQAIPMTWAGYAEGNVFSDSTGAFSSLLEWIEKFLVGAPATVYGASSQEDASSQNRTEQKLVSTDPPYYDNVGYADLSDFFYVWLRYPHRSFDLSRPFCHARRTEGRRTGRDALSSRWQETS